MFGIRAEAVSLQEMRMNFLFTKPAMPGVRAGLCVHLFKSEDLKQDSSHMKKRNH